MDLDALTSARRQEWDRLAALQHERSLSGEDADELVARYRSASADLAEIKTVAGRSPQADVVSTLLSSVRVRMTTVRGNPLRGIPAFFTLLLPAALYRLRWTTLAVAVVFVVVGGAVALWISGDPALVASLGSEADLQYYAQQEFVDYYSRNPAAEFAGTVWTNNAWIAVQSVVFGITGFWPVMVLVQNAVQVGIAAAVMIAFGQGDVFVLFILPHGQLELTAIFVACAAGLHLFWALVAPGARSRADAVVEAALSLLTVAIGLVFVLFVSGIIEGFVTRQAWPWPIKIGIGAVALGAFLVVMLVVGRRADRALRAGRLVEDDPTSRRLVAG